MSWPHALPVSSLKPVSLEVLFIGFQGERLHLRGQPTLLSPIPCLAASCHEESAEHGGGCVQVPYWQSRIVQGCRKRGKPVIVATNMLESMIGNPTPTRAEVIMLTAHMHI